MYWLDIASWSIDAAPAASMEVERACRRRRASSRKRAWNPDRWANQPPEKLDRRRVQHSPRAADHLHMRPLIGVTTSELRPSGSATTRRHGEPAHPEMALGMTYLRTLDAAGAIPVVLPPVGTDHLMPLLDRLDGICLSGGPDLDPGAYGAPDRHPELGPTEPSLDAFELSLARQAITRGLPILAICRGAQALNVACGGTLHQHVGGHRQKDPATQPTHAVTVQQGSRLHRITRSRRLPVNSFHHQAVDELGSG